MHRLYYHIVWTTRQRQPLINATVASFLCRFFRAIAAQERVRILEIGIVATHVHVLVRAHPMTDLSRLLQRLKGSSAAVANKERHAPLERPLRWAKGYSLQTIGSRQVIGLRDYLRKQPLHHPQQAIPDWRGDDPEYERVGADEWRSEERSGLRVDRGASRG
ncbi:MAG TPA: IS200/IS605 family transposase [Gemmatimonadales bacterium]|nr:IS200/IS605 family transposase [Gemmatimonadales bacterium]